LGRKHLVLSGGTVVKGTDEPEIHEATVEIKDGIITDIYQGGNAASRDKGVSLDVGGMFLIPGLIDAHVHYATRFDAIRKLLLLHGITTVRDAEITPTRARIFNLRRKLQFGEKPNPRIFLTGPHVDSSPDSSCLTMPRGRFLVQPSIVDDKNLGSLAVSNLKKRGFDVVEVTFNIDKDVLKAIGSAARALGMPLIGDFMFSRRVFATYAAEVGVRALDHAGGIAQQFCKDLQKVGFFEEWQGSDTQRTLAFARDLARTGIFLIPTLVWFETQSKLSEYSEDQFQLIEKLPEQIRRTWKNPNPLFGMDRWMKGAKSTLERLREFLPIFVKSGGKLVVGTDSPIGSVFPGASVHREMELLVDAGLTPLEAIQSATRNASELLNENRIGTIENGKLADIVVLKEDPLKNVNAVRKIEMLIKNGEIYYPEKVLESIKG
jgi:hypothetical protein